MKFIAGYYTDEEANNLRNFLEENGIAVYVEYEGARGSGIKYSVFAALDSQHKDALQLMNDPNHAVMETVDAGQYQDYMASSEGKAQSLESMLRGILLIALVVISLGGTIAYLIR